MDPIKFHLVGDDYGWLSNFAPYPITLDGMMWYTAEHYFQTQKFHDETVKRSIRKTRSAREIMKIASNPKLRVRRDWDEIKIEMMRSAVRAKFTQVMDLKGLLLSTGDAELIEHTDGDSYWGDGGDGSGKNMLGVILMEVRDELRKVS